MIANVHGHRGDDSDDDNSDGECGDDVDDDESERGDDDR